MLWTGPMEGQNVWRHVCSDRRGAGAPAGQPEPTMAAASGKPAVSVQEEGHPMLQLPHPGGMK